MKNNRALAVVIFMGFLLLKALLHPWVRAVWTIALLVIVWRHAHWSIAVCLSLGFARAEVAALATGSRR
jgi:hypothetical protein